MDNVVLLVDDDQNVLHGLARALRHQPYQLYTAISGEQALAILKARNVDVIVTDEQMPGMCGSDLHAWVAEHCPDVARIALTGHPTVETAIRAINEGAVYQFFTKPCNPARLAVAIRKALEHKALVLENRQLLDVTRRHLKQIERAKQHIESLATLIAQDIRRPLQTVVSSSRSLGDRLDDDFGRKAAELTENALDGVAEAQRLLDDLLEPCRTIAFEPPAGQFVPDSGAPALQAGSVPG